MIKRYIYIIIFLIMGFFNTNTLASYEKLAYEFIFNDLNGEEVKFSDYKNKVIVVVNVASQCGFTKQYDDMQKIWELYQDKGLVMIGVPSNDFGNQEPEDNSQIKKFCETNFGITFPMMEKTNVKGNNAHPLYLWALKNYGKAAVPKWNFHKIIIGKNGKVFDTFSSITNPTSKRFVSAIEKALN